MGRHRLSIIIPTYNGLGHLQRCLPTVLEHRPEGTEVLVVDDASTDGTCDWLRSRHPWVRTLALTDNRGFCGAVNHGLAHAQGDVIELLNNDTEVCSYWAERALRHFEDPTVGSVAPLVLSMDQPEVIDSAGQTYHLCGWAQNRGIGQRLGPRFKQQADVFGPTGSSGFYRRSALERTGGLLAEYGAYFEDTDLAFRLRWAGYRCIFEPESVVLHKGSASYGQQPARLVQLISRNEELVFWINLPAAQLLLGLVPHVGFQLVRLLRKTLTGQLQPFLKGKWQAIGCWRQVAQRRRELRQLAAAANRRIELAVSANPDVFRQGLSWMAWRRSA